MRQFYLLTDPMQTVYAESLGAIYGGDPKIPQDGLTAWVARAMATGQLVNPCPCCTKSTDMVTDTEPSIPIPREVFYAQYREMSLSKH